MGALTTSIFSFPAFSAQWSLTGTLNPAVTYNDNLFMLEDKESTFQYTATPTLILSRADDDNTQTLSAGYVGQRYSSFSYLNQQFPFARFSSSFLQDRSSWGIDASYVENTTRAAAEQDTGDFVTEARLKTESISPRFSYNVTELDTLTLSGGFTQSTTQSDQFSDNEVLFVRTGWNRKLTEKMSAGLDFTVTRFEADNGSFITDNLNYNLSTSLNYNFRETWSANFRLGARFLDSERTVNNAVIDGTDSGGTLSVNITRNTELSSHAISVSRDLAPSLNGNVNEVTSVSYNWSRSISERLSTRVSTSYQQLGAAFEGSKEQRENIHFSPTLSWSATQNLTFNLVYTYQQQINDSINQDVNRNTLAVTLNYNWDGIRASR